MLSIDGDQNPQSPGGMTPSGMTPRRESPDAHHLENLSSGRKTSRRRLRAEVIHAEAERLKLQEEVEQLRAIIWGCSSCSQHVCLTHGQSAAAIADVARQAEEAVLSDQAVEDGGEPASEPPIDVASSSSSRASADAHGTASLQGRLRAALNEAVACHSLHLAIHHQIGPGRSVSTSSGMTSVLAGAGLETSQEALRLQTEESRQPCGATVLHSASAPSLHQLAAELAAPCEPDHARVALERIASLGYGHLKFGQQELISPEVLNRVPTYLPAPRDACLLSAELVFIAYSTLHVYLQQQHLTMRRRADFSDAWDDSELRLKSPSSARAIKSLREMKLKDMIGEMRGRFAELQVCDPRDMDHEQRLVFWLNILNAAVMASLCLADEKPGQHGQVFPVKAWIHFLQMSHIDVSGHEFSIFEVEHLMLRACSKPPTGKLAWMFVQAVQEAHHKRPKLCEPRFGCGIFDLALQAAVPEVSFGISYPIRAGYPPLRVYRPRAVKQQLLLNGAHYIRSGLQVDAHRRRVQLPVLFKHYFHDFGSSAAEVLDFARSTLLAVPGALESVKSVTGCRASLADSRLAAESGHLASFLEALQGPNLKGSTASSDAAAKVDRPSERSTSPSRVNLQTTDFDWTFHFETQVWVCPELECRQLASAVSDVATDHPNPQRPQYVGRRAPSRSSQKAARVPEAASEQLRQSLRVPQRQDATGHGFLQEYQPKPLADANVGNLGDPLATDASKSMPVNLEEGCWERKSATPSGWTAGFESCSYWRRLLGCAACSSACPRAPDKPSSQRGPGLSSARSGASPQEDLGQDAAAAAAMGPTRFEISVPSLREASRRLILI